MAVGAWWVFVPCGHLEVGENRINVGSLEMQTSVLFQVGKKKDLSFFSLSVHFSIVFISLIWLRFTKMPFMSINPKCFVGSTQVREIFWEYFY